MKPKTQNTNGLIRRCLLAGTLAVGGTLGVVGCDSSGNLYPSSQAAIGSATLQNIAATNQSLTYNQVQSLGALGGLLGMVSHQESMREAARQGRSEVNIHLNGQRVRNSQDNSSSNTKTKFYGPSLLPEYNLRKIMLRFHEGFPGLAAKRIRQIFTFNNNYDFNGDGRITFNEFVGIKRNFKKNEEINVYFQMANYKEPLLNFFGIKKSGLTKLSASVFDKNGGKIFEDSFDLNSPLITKFKIPENLNSGTYKIKIKCTNKKGKQEYKEQIFQILE